MAAESWFDVKMDPYVERQNGRSIPVILPELKSKVKQLAEKRRLVTNFVTVAELTDVLNMVIEMEAALQAEDVYLDNRSYNLHKRELDLKDHLRNIDTKVPAAELKVVKNELSDMKTRVQTLETRPTSEPLPIETKRSVKSSSPGPQITTPRDARLSPQSSSFRTLDSGSSAFSSPRSSLDPKPEV